MLHTLISTDVGIRLLGWSPCKVTSAVSLSWLSTRPHFKLIVQSFPRRVQDNTGSFYMGYWGTGYQISCLHNRYVTGWGIPLASRFQSVCWTLACLNQVLQRVFLKVKFYEEHLTSSVTLGLICRRGWLTQTCNPSALFPSSFRVHREAGRAHCATQVQPEAFPTWKPGL